MISVLVPQNRIGGLDILLSGLARQTLPRDQFELILIDDLHQFRADLVRNMVAAMDLQVAHLPPRDVPKLPCGLYEQGHYQRALNTGLMHARGDHCIVLCDYTYLHEDTLSLHVQYHGAEQSGMKLCVMGIVDNVDIRPHLHPSLPNRWGWYAMGERGHNSADYAEGQEQTTYGPWLDAGSRMRLSREWFDNYTADLATGKLDAFMWSVLHKPIEPGTDISDGKFRVWQVGRGKLPAGKQHHQICYLKNDSFSTEDLLAINGWDEDMDGCHGHQDSELAGRLENKLGMEYWLFPTVKATLFDPHGVAIIRDHRKPEHHNLHLYSRKFDRGEWPGGSVLDLKKERGAAQ